MRNAESDAVHDDYWFVRFHSARRAGLTMVEAKRFADGTVTLKTLREMRAAGARPETIARVVT